MTDLGTRYTVEHQDWCHAIRHRFCCSSDTWSGVIDHDDCDCGGSETQGVIDRLTERLERVKRAVNGTGSSMTSLRDAEDFVAEVNRAVYGDVA